MDKVPESAVGHGLASQTKIKVGEILEVTRVELLAGQICQKCFLPMIVTGRPRARGFLLQQILNKSVGQLVVVQLQHVVRLLARVLVNPGHHIILYHVSPY